MINSGLSRTLATAEIPKTQPRYPVNFMRHSIYDGIETSFTADLEFLEMYCAFDVRPVNDKIRGQVITTVIGKLFHIYRK